MFAVQLRRNFLMVIPMALLGCPHFGPSIPCFTQLTFVDGAFHAPTVDDEGASVEVQLFSRRYVDLVASTSSLPLPPCEYTTLKIRLPQISPEDDLTGTYSIEDNQVRKEGATAKMYLSNPAATLHQYAAAQKQDLVCHLFCTGFVTRGQIVVQSYVPQAKAHLTWKFSLSTGGEISGKTDAAFSTHSAEVDPGDGISIDCPLAHWPVTDPNRFSVDALQRPCVK